MSHELICSWLGLASGEWPPDHYRLLGLKPGEGDVELIEREVHQRLAAVRRYQVCHPEQATEAMNRLAQAFVCLTEPAAKRRYDAELLGEPVPPVSTQATSVELLAATTIVLEVPASAGPAPPRSEGPPPLPLPPVTVSDATPLPTRPAVPRPPPKPPAEKIDPILEAAASPPARRRLGTRRALLRRVRVTRQLIDAWGRAGKYLGATRRRFPKGPEAERLADLFDEITWLCRRFPRILGEAGRPGYLVLSLARRDGVPTLNALEASQREALRRDWQAGQKLLLAHRDFLREQAAELRLMTRGQRFGRAVRALLSDQPGTLLLLLALLALNLLLWGNSVRGLFQRPPSNPAPPPAEPAAP